MELKNARHAFVTGGASGIGLGIVGAFVRRGIKVTIADIDRAAIDAAVGMQGGHAYGVELDVRDRGGWQRAKSDAEITLGPVDILVNNAGIWADGVALPDMAPESFDRLFAVDVTGVFNGVAAFGAALRQRRRGHIVNTASIMGLCSGAPGMAAYTAAKSAVVSLTEVLRLELAPHDVGVSVLCPGLVTSNLIANSRRAGSQVRDEEATHGAGRQGMPPAQAGEIVCNGIERNELYIFTHAEYAPAFERRAGAVMQAFHAVAR